MDGAAGPPDEGADQFARVFEAERRVLSETDAALSVRPLGAEESDRERRDRRLLLGGANLARRCAQRRRC